MSQEQDSGAVPDASTINTFIECAYDGGETGSTEVLVFET